MLKTETHLDPEPYPSIVTYTKTTSELRKFLRKKRDNAYQKERDTGGVVGVEMGKEEGEAREGGVRTLYVQAFESESRTVVKARYTQVPFWSPELITGLDTQV